MISLLADYRVPLDYPDIDSYFYPLVGLALIVVLVILGFRRWGTVGRRRRRGACVTCGYDLRGSKVTCPECGTMGT